MSTQTAIRKLTAILYADVAGYSRLTGGDEQRALWYLFSFEKDKLSVAVELFRRAVDIDPKFSAAYAFRARLSKDLAKKSSSS